LEAREAEHPLNALLRVADRKAQVRRHAEQLDDLRTRVEHRVTEMRETGAPVLREQWAEQAAAIGMTIEEIVEGSLFAQ
jgi:hypothetical protein